MNKLLAGISAGLMGAGGLFVLLTDKDMTWPALAVLVGAILILAALAKKETNGWM